MKSEGNVILQFITITAFFFESVLVSGGGDADDNIIQLNEYIELSAV